MASGKTHSSNNKNTEWWCSVHSLKFSVNLFPKHVKHVASVSCCNHVPELCHSSSYNSWLSWAHRSTMENWTGCFLLGRLCLNILLWKCVGGRTHSVANRSLFSKHSSKSVLSSVQETSISVQCQFSISDSCLPVTVPETHTRCQFCGRGLKTSCKKSDVMPVCLMPLEEGYRQGATFKKDKKLMKVWCINSGVCGDANMSNMLRNLFEL